MLKVVISSGHGLYVRGACGILDEVDEARRVVNRVAEELQSRGADVMAFHDNSSKSQNENLSAIVNFHNAQERDLDVSVHFNAFEQREGPSPPRCPPPSRPAASSIAAPSDARIYSF